MYPDPGGQFIGFGSYPDILVAVEKIGCQRGSKSLKLVKNIDLFSKSSLNLSLIKYYRNDTGSLRSVIENYGSGSGSLFRRPFNYGYTGPGTLLKILV
jgi:hypothetical protein